MDSKNEDTINIEMEEDNAEKALDDWRKTGITERRCLRCGGRFTYFIATSGYKIQCEREGCFVMTARGI